MPARAIPLAIATSRSDAFSVQTKMSGTFQVRPGYIEVAISTAYVQMVGSPTNRRGRVVSDVKIGLAESIGPGGKWHKVPSLPLAILATPDKVMQVGETAPLTTRTVRLPIAEALDLSNCWFLVEISVTHLDPTNPDVTKTGVCYAHSSRNIFAAAK
jgi:hypothetical protein